ncbi:hypothetical protein QYF61_021386 [Mycteria americana]|uniref:Secreted protein n=1 Tax=Mycteria americana TaxID=33587 RepID=A0AAN7MIM5_MYCAM|nr:hypothetical protein QYF61_013965 [Mycteria americana]KAK4806550.1 hypothetical protein QYF61_021386 [Mycteria americana]
MVFVLGKTLIIMLVVANRHLYTPMSCFLGHLSSLETFYRSSTLPQVMAHFMTGDSTISAHHFVSTVSCTFGMYRGFTTAKRTWTGMCCVLTNPLEAWDMEKAFGVSRGREVGAGGARWCHRETSFQHVGKAREIREVPRSSEKANIKPMFKKGKKEDWENDRLVSFPSVPGKVMGQVLLQPSPGT